MKKNLNFFVIAFFCAFQISCATIINGSTETIQIQVVQDNAKVYVNDVLVGVSKVNDTFSSNVLRAEIPKRREIIIRVEKEGCDKYFQIVPKKIDFTTFIGLLIDRGLISILLVDLYATNAFYQAAQTYYSINLNCDG